MMYKKIVIYISPLNAFLAASKCESLNHGCYQSRSSFINITYSKVFLAPLPLKDGAASGWVRGWGEGFSP